MTRQRPLTALDEVVGRLQRRHGPAAVRWGGDAAPAEVWPTGIPVLDAALPQGLPCGRLTVLTGEPSRAPRARASPLPVGGGRGAGRRARGGGAGRGAGLRGGKWRVGRVSARRGRQNEAALLPRYPRPPAPAEVVGLPAVVEEQRQQPAAA